MLVTLKMSKSARGVNNCIHCGTSSPSCLLALKDFPCFVAHAKREHLLGLFLDSFLCGVTDLLAQTITTWISVSTAGHHKVFPSSLPCPPSSDYCTGTKFST
ncbi:hypothetical protein ATANTOWER_001240 [Ataeniobius toweri]|uniref:Uncharacterized protein n=1 Tax=Ataeniobius toweri TaxID=208326 RepID=A0ABU7A3Q5_9TELE|nr:hypothetical protein [Ataeniobius toweri]